MGTFTRSRRDTAEVPHPVEAVWDVLVDPDAIARLTPLVASIEDDGEGCWTWSLQGVPVPGRRLDLSMSEQMTFTPRTRIEFAHGPLGGGARAGAAGHYALEPSATGTRLTIDLTVSAQLPLPGLARPAVHTVMQQVLNQMGSRFATNLLAELERRG